MLANGKVSSKNSGSQEFQRSCLPNTKPPVDLIPRSSSDGPLFRSVRNSMRFFLVRFQLLKEFLLTDEMPLNYKRTQLSTSA